MHNPLLRRTLAPLLIVVLPVVTMMAWILYQKQAGLKTQPPHPLAAQEDATRQNPDSSGFGGQSWPVFRGDASLTGQAEGNLPDAFKLAWTFQTGGEIKSAPVIAGGVAYVSSLDKHLYAIELQAGIERWRFEADDELEASPLFFDNVIYIGSNGGTVYAIDAATGQSKWILKEAGKITGSANIALHPTTGKPVIVFGSYDNNLYCLNAADGTLVFKQPAQNYINGAVALSGETAFFGSCDALIYQVPLSNPAATVTLDSGSYVAANPAIRDKIIYAGNYDGKFFAADSATQKILWSYDKTQDAFFSSPAVGENVVIVGCRDGKLYCFDKTTGAVRWMFSAGGNFDSSPVICGDKTVVGNDDGRLYIVNIQTGQEVFSCTLGSPIVSSPAIAQNYCLIGCDNGILYAFTAQ